MQNVQINNSGSAAQNDEFELDVQVTTFDNPAPMRPPTSRTTITGAPMRPTTGGHTTITGRQ